MPPPRAAPARPRPPVGEGPARPGTIMADVRARSSNWIERGTPKPQVGRSNRLGRTKFTPESPAGPACPLPSVVDKDQRDLWDERDQDQRHEQRAQVGQDWEHRGVGARFADRTRAVITDAERRREKSDAHGQYRDDRVVHFVDTG